MKIEQIIKLARIDLSTKEKKKFECQLESILNYIKKLNEVKTEKVEPIASINGLSNVSCKDEIMPSLSREKLLQNAPQKENGHLKVKAVFGETK
jgi:aspartyl-tRNA(Asn)/glutamyl-tRNA(Gln) amidotransferase subunit C